VYLRPTTVRDACAALAGRRLTLLAGGTDHYATGAAGRRGADILDLSAVADLRGIRREGAGLWRIGATTTWSEVLAARLPPAFDALKQAAREVGGAQIQNAGTVAGNLCNASPAADGVPPLLALDASVELASARGTRTLALRDFILGSRKTALAPDELVAAIVVPAPPSTARSRFLKLGARRYLVISIAMVAVVLEPEGKRVARARVAIGACSAVAQRLAALEAALAGAELAGLGEKLRPEHFADLKPIDDVRASAAYRRDAARVLVRRALDEAAAS
jgi:CO/xanthine dehydrogenase FAD-binding subunit